MGRVKRVYGKRALLNQPGFESTGAIVAELTLENYGWEATLSISDCSRRVELSIANPTDSSEERFENDLEKVDILIDALKEFRKGMLRVRRLR